MKLRLKLYPAVMLLGLACCGCFSVEYQTRVDRRGGGTRTIEVVMDPVMAGFYNKASVSDKLFNLPGQGLQSKPGVTLTGSSQAELEGGSRKLRWSYRARRMQSFSDGNDSVQLDITRSGIWVYYQYRERVTASKTDEARPLAGQNVYRIRHMLSLPGQIITHNADSAGDGCLVWNRPLGQVTAAGLDMEARSREFDPFYLLLALLLLAAGAGLAYRYSSRRPAGKMTFKT